MYMSMSDSNGGGKAAKTSLTSQDGSEWNSPPISTPIDPSSGYLKALAASCTSCDSIRDSKGTCTCVFW